MTRALEPAYYIYEKIKDGTATKEDIIMFDRIIKSSSVKAEYLLEKIKEKYAKNKTK